MKTLFVLSIIDYLLTYTGIKNGIIHEANPLMGWLFQMPIECGLPIRAAIMAALIAPLYVYRDKPIARAATATGIVANLFVLSLHINWIFKI